MIIFLDFDGVLHPRHVPDGSFSQLNAFLELLDEFPLVQLVISSSWRVHMDKGTLASLFGRHEVKVIGATPVIKGQVQNDFYRLSEIQAWIEGTNYKGPWLAIDDADEEFPFEYPHLFLCDGHRGLDEQALQDLRQRLREMNA